MEAGSENDVISGCNFSIRKSILADSGGLWTYFEVCISLRNLSIYMKITT